MKDARSHSLALLKRALVRVPPVAPRKRRPPKGSAPALVEPPRGPLPMQGGAAAPLEFEA